MRAARSAYRLDLCMGGGVVMFPDAIDTATENDAVPTDDESSEGNSAVPDMVHGEGDRLLHEPNVVLGRAGNHQACPWSFALSASFSQTTPAMMTPSHKA